MHYLPHTDKEIADMLQTIGVNNIDDIFSTIPKDNLNSSTLALPFPLTEFELNDHMDKLSKNMAVTPEYKIFIGAGSYDHFIPFVVPYLLNRSEFMTAYTPYQPEMSQGTLQAIYEYQTLAARLMGTDIATASHYDGATALAEALLISVRKTKRKNVAISSLIHPMYRKVIKTYFRPTEYNILEIPYLENGLTDISVLDSMEDIGGVAVQSPNFFGCIEDLKTAAEKIHAKNGIFIASYTEALAYGLLKSPGYLGGDLVAGEGQSLGITESYGGPALGMLGSSKKFMRDLPGRIVGRCKDVDGKDGFVLTLSTREQHIRREKATSNICSNNSLCAVSAAIYMALLGNTGIRKLAQLNHDKAEYLKNEIKNAGFDVPFSSPTFNEFVVKFPEGFAAEYSRLVKKKLLAGLPLAGYYPELKNHYLLCVTETKSKEDIDCLVREIKL